jgi:hypothetical protein
LFLSIRMASFPLILGVNLIMHSQFAFIIVTLGLSQRIGMRSSPFCVSNLG